MLEQSAQDLTFMSSYLYYFGMLTIAGKTPTGYLLLEPPNLVIKNVYANQVLRFLLPQGLTEVNPQELLMNFSNIMILIH